VWPRSDGSRARSATILTSLAGRTEPGRFRPSGQTTSLFYVALEEETLYETGMECLVSVRFGTRARTAPVRRHSGTRGW
jgi:hypothetical protein